jgi:predicted MFS family arabinose efflux permease
MMAAFMIIPYIAPQLQNNMHYPRESLSILYFVGGLVSFFAMRAAGYCVDKYGTTFTTLIGVSLIGFSLLSGFIFQVHIIPALLIFTPFMVGMSVRNIASFTNASMIPTMFDRAGYMSLVSCFQHIFSSIGAALSAAILVEIPSGEILNVEYIGIISLVLFSLTIPLIHYTEQAIKVRR